MDLRNIKGGAIIMDKDENVLLIQQAKNRSWSLPKGSLKEGETKYEAAIRETLEETGLDLSHEKPIGVYETKEYESTFLFLIFKINKSYKNIPVKLTIDNRAYIWLPFKPYSGFFLYKNKVNKVTFNFFKQTTPYGYKNFKNTNLDKIKTKRYTLNNKNNNNSKKNSAKKNSPKKNSATSSNHSNTRKRKRNNNNNEKNTKKQKL